MLPCHDRSVGVACDGALVSEDDCVASNEVSSVDTAKEEGNQMSLSSKRRGEK